MRKIQFADGEYYHIYNRGTEKRSIFSDEADFERFLKSLTEFNTLNPIGSLYEHSQLLKHGSWTSTGKEKLVELVAYCLNPNHYHLILRQTRDKGIEKYMQRLGTGYTKYFNLRHQRTGALFQGRFKAEHIDTNVYLLHASAYVNLNFRIHRVGESAFRSSWFEYLGQEEITLCEKREILGQFGKKEDYKHFAENSALGTLDRREALSTYSSIFDE